MFEHIETFLNSYSYKFLTINVVELGKSRYCILNPINQYFINSNGFLYLLLEKKFNTFICNENNNLALKFSAHDANSFTCIYCSKTQIEKIHQLNYVNKFVLLESKQTKSLINIINMCIEKGIFTLF